MGKLTPETAENIRKAAQESPDHALVLLKAHMAGEAFAESTPEFDGSPENSKAIGQYLEERQQEVTVPNLRNAFEILVADGKIKPLAVEPEAPVATPVPAATPAPQGPPALSDEQFRYEIEKLSSEEYRRRLVHEPGFRERCDRVMAHEAAVVDWNNPAAPSSAVARPATQRPAATPEPVAGGEFADKLQLEPRAFLRWVDEIPSHIWRRILQNNPEVVAKYEKIISPRS